MAFIGQCLFIGYQSPATLTTLSRRPLTAQLGNIKGTGPGRAGMAAAESSWPGYGMVSPFLLLFLEQASGTIWSSMGSNFTLDCTLPLSYVLFSIL